MPQYNPNAKPPQTKEVAPEGDVILRVVEYAIGISGGAQLAGCPCVKLKLAIEKDGEPDPRFWNVEEQLTDDSSRGEKSNQTWEMFQFVKACGIKLADNEAFEFDPDEAQRAGARWINPVGLRCHARIVVDSFARRNDAAGVKSGRSNKVKTWYVDRAPLSRVEGTSDELEKDDAPF